MPDRFEAKAMSLGLTTPFHWRDILYDMKLLSRDLTLMGYEYSDNEVEKVVEENLEAKVAGLGLNSGDLMLILVLNTRPTELS